MNPAGFAAAGVLREEKADLDVHVAGRCNHGAAWSTCITPPAQSCPHTVTCHLKPEGVQSSLVYVEAFYHVQPLGSTRTLLCRLTSCQLSVTSLS